MQTLWNKGVSATQMVEDFTVGNDRELDLKLAKYDVLGSKAHIAMLAEVGLLAKDEEQILSKELDAILAQIEAGNFVMEDEAEDIHSQIEILLTRKLGSVGKKIHSGRSRNDQVLVDLKLYMRDELDSLAEEVKSLFSQYQSLSEQYKEVLLPGYTHAQVAMPSSFGLWFGAYAETLADDMVMIRAARRIVDQNPLGSAAGYGSSFPLDRKMTTRLLDFADLHRCSDCRCQQHPQQIRCGLLYVYVHQFPLHFVPRLADYREQHNASQEKPGRMGDGAGQDKPPAERPERNSPADHQPAPRLSP